MKRVFCRGLAVSSMRDDRSYATVAAAGVSPGSCTDSDDRKVLGLLPLKTVSSDKCLGKPVKYHKVTMCNDDRSITAVSTGTGKQALCKRSIHKSTVGKGHADTSDRVLLVHNKFSPLCPDTPHDAESTGDKVVPSFQNIQTTDLVCPNYTDTANVTKASTSRYFGHSSCYSSRDIIHTSREQLSNKFGSFPLFPVLLYNGHRSEVLDVSQTQRLIRQSGVPNFLGLRIPVKTQWNIPAWRFHLQDYFDQQLLDVILSSSSLSSSDDNHTSAIKYPSHVQEYLLEELNHNTILGPFPSPPFPIHVSPFMTREKSGSDKRRTIIDLSWPKGLSVNDGVTKDLYLGTHFEMHYPSVDHIVDQLNHLGPAAQIFKVDISRAFRHIRIDPGDIDLLRLKFKDNFFIDLSLPFGFRFGSFFLF